MPSTANPGNRRIETASGATDGSGDFAVTFSPSFPAVPHIAPAILNQANPNHKIRILAVSAAGCTVRVEVQDESFLSLLGVNVLLASVTAVAGATVCIKATAQA